MIPGKLFASEPLHRLVDGWDAASTARRAANESNKNAACASWRAANPTVDVTGKDCDEFPFASSLGGRWTRQQELLGPLFDLAQNRSAGGALAGWCNNQRILQQDAFYVKIQP